MPAGGPPPRDYDGRIDLLLLTIRVVLAAVLVVAGASKALDLAGSRQAVADFGAPRRLADPLGTVLPVAELGVAVLLLLDGGARPGGVLALGLFAVFTLAVGRAVLRGEAPQCHCFGQLHSEPAGPATLARNAVLAVLALVVVVGGAGRTWSALTGPEAGTVVGFVLAAGLGLASWSLWSENRRLRRRVDGTDQPDLGLAPGTPAPDVPLRSLHGDDVVGLRSVLRPGAPTVLVQVSPFCGPCAKLLPELARWEDALREHLDIVVVSAGDGETNREFARASGRAELLYTEDLELGTAFRALVTPSAILIDGEGRVADRPVAGADAIESLVRVQLRRATDPGLTVAAAAR